MAREVQAVGVLVKGRLTAWEGGLGASEVVGVAEGVGVKVSAAVDGSMTSVAQVAM